MVELPPVRLDFEKSSSSRLRDSKNTEMNNPGVNRLLPGWEHVSNEALDKVEGLEIVKDWVANGKIKLNETGVFGETLLHWALLMHHGPVSKWLINLTKDKYDSLPKRRSDDEKSEDCPYPEFKDLRPLVYGEANDSDNQKRYRGEGCLHLAIANRDLDMARNLLESYHKNGKVYSIKDFKSNRPVDFGYPLNKQRAIGTFFEKTGDNSVYYGETAIDFAVSTNQIDMVDLLMGGPHDGKFNGLWRASLKLKETAASHHQNSVFHICALRGHVEMWNYLIKHMERTVAEESGNKRQDVEVELSVEMWVRSQVNKYGLTPLQVAAYKNSRDMVECILKQTRLKIWKWGEEAFYGYTLNEIDEFYESPMETPGIPVNTIIICEGHFEMLSIPIFVKLMKQKWNSFGWKWVVFFSVVQLVFCITLTGLFIETYPKLNDPSAPWGRDAIEKPWQRLMYIFVLIKASCEMVCMCIEMASLWKANLGLKKEILRQQVISEHQEPYSKTESELQRSLSRIPRASSNVAAAREVDNLRQQETCCQWMKRLWSSFTVMSRIYFELDLNFIPSEFHDPTSKKRAHTSVAGAFLALSWIANISFFIAQVTALLTSREAAQALLVMMICILVCEYVQLFLWFQTYKQIGRFISSVVNIFSKDVLGFAVVFLITLISFSFCFLLLNEDAEVNYKWITAFYITYELSVGTGEWFKDKMDDTENDPAHTDRFQRALTYVLYIFYISITLVILMNLLIAVMSETAISLAKQMHNRELSLKLSSVSLVSRRLRALLAPAQIFCRLIRFQRGQKLLKRLESKTIGGRSGDDLKLLDGRLVIRTTKAKLVERASTTYLPPDWLIEKDLEDYYLQMRYWTILEHEDMGIDKDGLKVDAKAKAKDGPMTTETANLSERREVKDEAKGVDKNDLVMSKTTDMLLKMKEVEKLVAGIMKLFQQSVNHQQLPETLGTLEASKQ